jgi:hypothetical protein
MKHILVAILFAIAAPASPAPAADLAPQRLR